MRHFVLFAMVLTLVIGSVGLAGAGLLAVDGATGNASTLYELDPNDGSIIQVIGPIGFAHVVSIEFHPITGVLYGIVNDRLEFNNGELITIDLNTGIGTVVAGQTGTKTPDISFDSNGTLYAWSENDDNLYTIDLTTGTATKVGESGMSTARTGLAFDSSDKLFVKSGLNLQELDPATGLPIGGDLGLTGAPNLHNMLAFDENDVLYSAERTGGGATLYTIDTTTGDLTTIGSNSINKLAGLAFGVVDVVGDLTINITANPNPATVGNPLEILLDLENPGDGFNANFGLWVLVNNNVTTLVSLSPFVDADLVLTGENIFSTDSVPAGLPDTVAFLAAIFDAGSGDILDSDTEFVGIGVAPSAADLTVLRQTATNFLNSGAIHAAPGRPEPELNFNGTAKNPFGQQVNSKGKLTTTWGRIKSQR